MGGWGGWLQGENEEGQDSRMAIGSRAWPPNIATVPRGVERLKAEKESAIIQGNIGGKSIGRLRSNFRVPLGAKTQERRHI